MKSIKIAVTGTEASVTEKPVLTSGTVGLPVEFIFDEAWDGLDKTAVFRAGSRSYPVSCLQDAATVPWEVMEKPGVGLYIGVLGADHRAVVKIPTVWVLVDTIAPGTGIPDTVPTEPTAQVYDQILSAANQAADVANSVREDADAGKFIGPAGPAGPTGPKGKDGANGYTPVRGTDYWTEADKAEIKSYVDDAILGGAW